MKDKTMDKVFVGLPYMYRESGLPSEIYEVRLTEEVREETLNVAIADTLKQLPHFGVRFVEKDGAFYAMKNEEPLLAIRGSEGIALGGKENHYHVMGVTFEGRTLQISFHHGLTDGRGAKSFLETLLDCYALRLQGEEPQQAEVGEPAAIYQDPCEKTYHIQKVEKIEGLEKKGFSLPQNAHKSGHRRYELKFSQDAFMAACKERGASPLILLSMMMSRGIAELYPDAKEPVISHFPIDARAILGCEETFKNCVKSMSLPYGQTQAQWSDAELVQEYRRLLKAQRNESYCAKEFNTIRKFLSVVEQFHSFYMRRKLLKFMENLSMDTYLISYVGEFSVPENLVEEVHLYSSCSSGLVLNMTCQNGSFVIDLTQDFKAQEYVEALLEQFARLGISVQVSGEILFETPCDALGEIITSPRTAKAYRIQMQEKICAMTKASTQALKHAIIGAETPNVHVKRGECNDSRDQKSYPIFS